MYFAILACEATGLPESLIAITVRRIQPSSTDPSARKSVRRCQTGIIGVGGDTLLTTHILTKELLARLRDNGNLHVEWTPISIPLLNKQNLTSQTTPMTSWYPPRGPPTWRNIPALKDLGYTVSYIPSLQEFWHGWQPLEGWDVCNTKHVADVVLVTLAKGSLVKVQARITAVRILGNFIETYRVHIDVGTELDTKVPPCAFESPAHGDPNQCFTLIDYRFNLILDSLWTPTRRARTVDMHDFLVPL